MSGLDFAGLPFPETGRTAVTTENTLQAVVVICGVGETSGTLLSWQLFDDVVNLIGGFGQDAGTKTQAAIGVILEFTIQLTFLH